MLTLHLALEGAYPDICIVISIICTSLLTQHKNKNIMLWYDRSLGIPSYLVIAKSFSQIILPQQVSLLINAFSPTQRHLLGNQ